MARVRSAEGVCPGCGEVSDRVHGRYQRTIRDSVIGGRPVFIRLWVRRFRCLAMTCRVVTFAEQVAGLTAPHARYSPLRIRAMTAIGLELAGRAGARLARVLGMQTSRMTLLRLVRALPEPELAAAPEILGVDDFALLSGHVYATVLIDMNTHRPVDVLPGRTAAVFETWLRQHPGARVICRDRAGSYADGARAGAPGAQQVADRWHLWHNLAEVVDKTVRSHRACLLEAARANPAGDPDSLDEPAPQPGALDAGGQERRIVARVRDQHAAVHALLAEGTSLNGISRQLGLAFRTVRRYARADDHTDLLGSVVDRASALDPFKPYLTRRWNEGCTNASQLHREVQDQGWSGSMRTVNRYLQAFRGHPSASPTQIPPPSPRTITTWIMSHPTGLTPDDAVHLKAIYDICPELASLAEHVRGFAEMMNNRHGHQLDMWIAEADNEVLPNLRSFANGLRRDHAAVTAGLTLPFSSGAVEGAVNKIKMLKRQMFGRANLDLLRIRVLHI